MEKKFMERPPKFNQNAYDKAHYKQFNTKIAADTMERITDYCKACEISKADFLRLAIDTLDK